MVRTPLLRMRRHPRKNNLLLRVQPGERQMRGRRIDQHVRREEMAASVEGVVFWIGDIGINDSNRNEAGPFVENLDSELRGPFAEEGGDEGAGLDGVAAEGDGDVGREIEVWEEVGDDEHLGQALQEEKAFVGAPFLEGEVAVDGAGHVAW